MVFKNINVSLYKMPHVIETRKTIKTTAKKKRRKKNPNNHHFIVTRSDRKFEKVMWENTFVQQKEQ